MKNDLLCMKTINYYTKGKINHIWMLKTLNFYMEKKSFLKYEEEKLHVRWLIKSLLLMVKKT